MIRRKLDQRSISVRGLFSKRSPEKADNNSSSTEPTEEANSALDFELPSWENPSNIATSPHPSPKMVLPRGGAQVAGFVKTDSPLSRPRVYSPRVDAEARGDGVNLTNMMVTCNNSFNSIDDITCVSFQDDDKSPRRYPTSPIKEKSSYTARNTIAGVGHTSASQSTSGTSQGFVWKRGPNGKFIKVSIENTEGSGMMLTERTSTLRQQPYRQPPEAPNQQSEAALQRMEEQMLNTALKLSKQESMRSLQAASFDQSFHEPQSPTTRNSPCHPQSSRLDNQKPPEICPTALRDQEEALVQLALDRSMHDLKTSCHNNCTTTSPRQLREGLRTQERQPRVLSLGGPRPRSSGTSTTTTGQRRTTSSSLRPRVAPSLSSSSTTATGGPKDFVWKKGPNNRYIKVPITLHAMDHVEEEESTFVSPTYNSNEERERLARMEEALVREAMKRSMNDA